MISSVARVRTVNVLIIVWHILLPAGYSVYSAYHVIRDFQVAQSNYQTVSVFIRCLAQLALLWTLCREYKANRLRELAILTLKSSAVIFILFVASYIPSFLNPPSDMNRINTALFLPILALLIGPEPSLFIRFLFGPPKVRLQTDSSAEIGIGTN